jgi:hypothetical protein
MQQYIRTGANSVTPTYALGSRFPRNARLGDPASSNARIGPSTPMNKGFQMCSAITPLAAVTPVTPRRSCTGALIQRSPLADTSSSRSSADVDLFVFVASARKITALSNPRSDPVASARFLCCRPWGHHEFRRPGDPCGTARPLLLISDFVCCYAVSCWPRTGHEFVWNGGFSCRSLFQEIVNALRIEHPDAKIFQFLGGQFRKAVFRPSR